MSHHIKIVLALEEWQRQHELPILEDITDAEEKAYENDSRYWCMNYAEDNCKKCHNADCDFAPVSFGSMKVRLISAKQFSI